MTAAAEDEDDDDDDCCKNAGGARPSNADQRWSMPDTIMAAEAACDDGGIGCGATANGL